MKLFSKAVSIVLVLALCVVPFIPTAFARESPIFANYTVLLPASMNAVFQVTTRKTVASVSISATMQVKENGNWVTHSTGVYPAFSKSNSTSWGTTANYAPACEKGSQYRLVVTYTVGTESVSYTTGSTTYN